MTRKFPLLLFPLLLLLSAPGRAEYKLLHAPDPDDPMQVHIYRLANGLTVYLTENHQEPRFYAEIAVRAGSKQDPPEATGIAHYLEHMLFKGSQKIGTLDYAKEKPHLERIEALYEERFHQTDPRKRAALYARINQENQQVAQYAIPNELNRLYTTLGAKALNAHTWVEETVFRVDVPANRLRQWARIEAERFHHPVFRLFQTELEAVYEEKNRSTDNKDRLIREAVARRLYKVHPYGQHTTLGSVEDLKNPSLTRMYAFYHTYYVPGNMALILSGDFHIEEAIKIIDAEFSAWEPAKRPRTRKWKEARLRGAERLEVTYPGEEYVLLAFRTAPRKHKDAEALEVLDMILDNRTAGLINLDLTQKQRLRAAGSYPWLFNDYGAQYLWGIPKQDQSLEEVEQLLLEELERLKEGRFDEWIIPAIVTDFKKTYKKRLEENNSRVALMREAFIAFEDWGRARRKLQRMGKLTKKDIVKVARKYFKDDYVAGYRRDGKPQLPSIDKPAIDPIDIDPARQSAFFSAVAAMPSTAIEPAYIVPGRDYQVRPLRRGIQLYYTHNPLNELFSFEISMALGNLAEPRLPIARRLLERSGTPRLSAEALKKEWYKLGTEFAMQVDDHETRLSLSGLDEHFAASLSLLGELLQQPTTGDSTLQKLLRIILVERADAQKDHHILHRALYQFHRYGENAYFRRVLPNQQLLQLSSGELLALVRQLPGYEQILSYTGSLSLDQVVALLEAHYPLAPEPRAPPPYQPLEIRRPTQTEIYFFDQDMAQALVRLESGDEIYSESRRPLIDLYNEYFYGGMAGIVFQELREARALAYQAWSWYFSAGYKEDYNFMGAFVGTQADKTPEAMEVFLDLLDHIPASEERFEAAQRAQINQYRTSRLSFRQLLGAVRHWEKQGVAVDPRSRRFERIQSASLNQVLDFQRRHIKDRPRLISIVGDRDKIHLEALEKYGKVIELNLKDLFAF